MGELRRQVREGALGPVSQLSADLGFPYAETEATASITAARHGGGALRDLGVYGVSVAHDLLGPPLEIEAQAIRAAGGSVRDVAILMRHEGGGRGDRHILNKEGVGGSSYGGVGAIDNLRPATAVRALQL